MSDESHPITRGVHHVGLTVPSLDETRTFFLETLGYRQVGEVPDYPAAFVSDGATMITLWQAENGGEAQPFDRRRHLGLHHLAIRVSEGGLYALHERLAARDDVTIEFPTEPLGGGVIRHMMPRILGGLRVEYIAPAAV